jgi:ribonuclease P protein component
LSGVKVALPKVHRLRHRQDFGAVYRLGLRRSAPHLTLIALKRRSPKTECHSEAILLSGKVPSTQIGISISQKVSKRFAMQQLLPEMSPGWQIVIVVKPSATQCDYGQLLQELKQLLKKAEVVDGH